jgi:hypothetical protein
MVFEKLTLRVRGKSGNRSGVGKGMSGKRVILEYELHLIWVFHQHLLE